MALNVTPPTETVGAVRSILKAALSIPGFELPTASAHAPEGILTALPSDVLDFVKEAVHGEGEPGAAIAGSEAVHDCRLVPAGRIG